MATAAPGTTTPNALTPEALAALQGYLQPQGGGSGWTAEMAAPSLQRDGLQYQVLYDNYNQGEGESRSGIGGPATAIQTYAPGKTNPGDTFKEYDTQGNFVRDGVFKTDEAMKTFMQFLAAAGGIYGLGTAINAASGAGAAGGAGSTLSKAALDGTASFGANSAPGALDISSMLSAAPGAEAAGAAAGDAFGTLSRAALDGTASFGANSVPGALDITTLANAAPGAEAASAVSDITSGLQSFANTNPTFNPAQDSQLANRAIEARAPGFEQFNGNALDGYLNSPLQTVPNPLPPSGLPPLSPPPGISDMLSKALKAVFGETSTGTVLEGLKLASAVTPLVAGEEEQVAEPAFVPPQPQIGEIMGMYTSPSAQGGASGTLAGVAQSLLTARDTFGYGRSMLG